jgi:hypothetical protein
MRFHLIPVFAIAIYLGAFVTYLNGQTPRPSADEVVATMLVRDAAREAASGGYTGRREYVLENQELHKRAEMLVSISCDGNGMKHFEVLSEDGWKSANKRVLHQMVDTESDSSRPQIRAKNRITSENYSFRMIDTGLLDGRTAYVIEATPRREDKALFRGRIWVDTEDYALVRVEGEPAKNPSFWTHKVHFVQQYYKSGTLWFPLSTTSVTNARIFGTTDVTIRYFDYKPLANVPNLHPDPSMWEANNVRH